MTYIKKRIINIMKWKKNQQPTTNYQTPHILLPAEVTN